MKLPRKQKKQLKKACQPLILVLYVEVGNMSDGEVPQYIERIMDKVKASEKEYIKEYFIPVRGQGSKVECINPVRIDNKIYKEIEDKLEKAQSEFNNFLKELKHGR